MRKKGIFNITALLLCAMIWGFAFSAQSVGAEYIGPWSFLAARAWIGVITLIVFILIRRTVIKHTEDGRWAAEDAGMRYGDGKSGKGTGLLVIAGASTGVLLCLASVLQQAGIAYTSVAKSGFITAMYVVIVPILSLLLGKKSGLKIWIAVLLSLMGLYLLSFSGGIEGINRGDLMTLGCAFLFACQIICINHFAPRLDGLLLSFSEFFFEALVATAGMLIFEEPDLKAFIPALGAILYAGIMSNGVAYTLQVIGQRDFDPTIASLCMCMESVFSALGGFLILGQTMTLRELIGCLLMFIAILTAELAPDAVLPEKEAG